MEKQVHYVTIICYWVLDITKQDTFLHTCTCTCIHLHTVYVHVYILTSILFQNVVDILVGWHIDTQQDESLITFIGGMCVTIATKKKLCSCNSDNTCL